MLEKVGCLAMTSAETECLFSEGSRTDEPSITLGKVEIEGDRALIGLVLSNYVLNTSRVRNGELGIQGGDEDDRVVCASDILGMDTSH